MAIRVILIDDHQGVHDIVAALLKQDAEIFLAGQSHRGEDALELCNRFEPDVVLMDVVLPGMGGVEAVRTLLVDHPDMRILALSSYREYEYIREMLDAGAIGYLVKDALVDDLVSTIYATYQGNTVLSPDVTRIILSPPEDDQVDDFDLTEREYDVLKLMAQGLNNSQIAQNLEISISTVRFHLGNILLKMKVETRSQALVLATKNNLI